MKSFLHVVLRINFSLMETRYNVVADGTTKLSRWIWYTRYGIQFSHFSLNLLWYLAAPSSDCLNFFYTCSVCQFNMVATKKHKHRHYYGIFSPWFPIFSFWISWMAEGQMIRIPNYKSVKSNHVFFGNKQERGLRFS